MLEQCRLVFLLAWVELRTCQLHNILHQRRSFDATINAMLLANSIGNCKVPVQQPTALISRFDLVEVTELLRRVFAANTSAGDQCFPTGHIQEIPSADLCRHFNRVSWLLLSDNRHRNRMQDVAIVYVIAADLPVFSCPTVFVFIAILRELCHDLLLRRVQLDCLLRHLLVVVLPSQRLFDQVLIKAVLFETFVKFFIKALDFAEACRNLRLVHRTQLYRMRWH